LDRIGPSIGKLFRISCLKGLIRASYESIVLDRILFRISCLKRLIIASYKSIVLDRIGPLIIIRHITLNYKSESNGMLYTRIREISINPYLKAHNPFHALTQSKYYPQIDCNGYISRVM
jgi:hypothetical protein